MCARKIVKGIDITGQEIFVKDLRNRSNLSEFEEVHISETFSVILVSSTVFKQFLVYFPRHYEQPTYKGIYLRERPFVEVVTLSLEMQETCHICNCIPCVIVFKGYTHEFLCGHCFRVKALAERIKQV